MARFGSRRFSLLAMAVFSRGSARAGLARDVAHRLPGAEGLDGGMVMPVGMAVITQAAAREGKQGATMSLLGLLILVAPVAGPAPGGRPPFRGHAARRPGGGPPIERSRGQIIPKAPHVPPVCARWTNIERTPEG